MKTKTLITTILSVFLIVGILGASIALFGGGDSGSSTGSGGSSNTSHEHIFKTEKILDDCTAGGEIVKTCRTCGHVEKEDIPASQHDMVIEENTTATCTSPGYRFHEYCTKCKYESFYEKTEALGHDLNVNPGLEATCTKAGYTESAVCKRCDYIQKSVVIQPLGHDIVEGESQAATCTVNGYTAEKTCTRCEYVEESQELKALGHCFKTIPEKLATCVVSGHSSYSQCTKCGATANKEIYPLTGHNFVDDVYIEATCLEGWYRKFHCDNPGCDVWSEATGNALGHDFYTYDEAKVEPTCTRDGYIFYFCRRCTEQYYEIYEYSRGHNFEDNICTICGYDSNEYQTLKIVNKHNLEDVYEYQLLKGTTWRDLAEDGSKYNTIISYAPVNNAFYIGRVDRVIVGIVSLDSEAEGTYFYEGPF